MHPKQEIFLEYLCWASKMDGHKDVELIIIGRMIKCLRFLRGIEEDVGRDFLISIDLKNTQRIEVLNERVCEYFSQKQKDLLAICVAGIILSDNDVGKQEQAFLSLMFKELDISEYIRTDIGALTTTFFVGFDGLFMG